MEKTEMNPKNREEGMLRMKILELIRNSDGMTLTEIAEKTKQTRYKIQLEVGKLIGLNELKMIQIGNYQVVRIK